MHPRMHVRNNKANGMGEAQKECHLNANLSMLDLNSKDNANNATLHSIDAIDRRVNFIFMSFLFVSSFQRGTLNSQEHIVCVT